MSPNPVKQYYLKQQISYDILTNTVYDAKRKQMYCHIYEDTIGFLLKIFYKLLTKVITDMLKMR